MFARTLVLFVLSTAYAGYSGGSTNNAIDDSSPTSNTFGYGYSGSFSGGAPPNFPIPNFDFSGLFNGYLEALNKYHQEFFRNLQGAAAGGGGGVGGGGFGGGFVGPDSVGLGFSGAGPIGGGFSFSGAPAGGASATASIGPGGGLQSAAVYPENPNQPNVNSRFGGSGQPGGFRSVSTFSSSHTTNVNGVPQTVQQATSTINDNGKVTTYTAKNP